MTIQPQITGKASLIYFYYGDEATTTLCQEQMRLKKAFKDYDRCVLLKHNTVPSWADFFEGDERNADLIDAPTKANLFGQLIDLTRRGMMIDLWIFTHGFTGGFVASKGTHGDTTSIRSADVRAELAPAKTGFAHVPIRMIWTTACYGASMNADWLSVGAKSVSAAQHVNFYPNQFARYADEWNKGATVKDALAKADTALSRTVVQQYIGKLHARQTRDRWGDCPGASNVLWQRDCARDYFTKMWLEKDSEYNPKLSGRDNMNVASKRIIGGSATMTRNTTPVW
jgi:hypothetical protein